MTTHSGSCLCGTVHYEVEGEFDSFFLCHCSHCRKGSGTAHGANLFSTTAQLSWLGGAADVQLYTLPGTRHSRSFCRHCGSALPTLAMAGKLLVVPAGSLDTPVAIKPNAHIFTGSRADWDEGLELVREFEGLPE